MPTKTPITVAHGDGIGPEIMNATLQILEAGGAAFEIETIEIGEKVYLRGNSSGIEPSSWASLLRTKVFLKAPITTPQGGGFKSLNVTTRKTLGQFANVRPCVSYHPFIDTKHPNMDVVIVRENEEDLYAGIEYQVTPEVTSCIKLISRPGSEKIVRYAFEYARRHNRKKVTCFMKDNIMKMTDGLFHKVFDEIAVEYPDVEKEAWIVDIGAAKMADTPEAFDVIVMPNLYGDILSDVAAQIAGSVGLAGSANIGEHGAMFEAIHGSAPRRARQNLANPSGLLLAAVQMLVHIGLVEDASTIHNAWLRTLEEGIHTYDIFKPPTSIEKVGTKEFSLAVIQRLGQKPAALKSIHYSAPTRISLNHKQSGVFPQKELEGIDIFIESQNNDVKNIHQKLSVLENGTLKLTMISNRGVRVWPEMMPETSCSDVWRCRFMSAKGKTVTLHQIAALIQRMADANIDFIKTEHLCNFDGVPGYTLAQDEQ